MNKPVYFGILSLLLIVIIGFLAPSAFSQINTASSENSAEPQQEATTQDTPQNFSLVVLPDTQFYSESYPVIFDNQTQWIANTVQSLNTLCVVHEGDIVNNGPVITQWQRANNSMSKLDGHVPWAVLPGTHDDQNPSAPSDNYINFNTYFPYSRFSGQNWYGGACNNVNTNSYLLFSGGPDDYLVFNFQYHPTDAILAWANTTITNYPTRRVIVTTHDYLDVDGSRRPEGNHIWNNFIVPHADQIFLVLCGHMHAENRRTDTVNGHTVYQLLADFQDYPNGGNGYLRVLDFRPTENKIYVKTYSPYLNQYQIDGDSQFTLNYDMTSDPPITITLQSPNNATTTIDNMPDFKFIPTHPDSLTFNCTLWLQNVTSSYVYATKNNALNGSQVTLTPSIPISNGAWSWWINCTDGSTSTISEKRTITINVFRGDKTFTSTQDGSTRTYWLDLPDNFDNSTPTPLVVFLHGYGGNRLSYLNYPILRQTFQNNTWIVASVDCRNNDWYTEPTRRDITDILSKLRTNYNINSNHIHVMGNSMGGGGALKYAMFNNRVIASIVDIHGIANFTQFYMDTQNQFGASLRAAYGGTPTQVPIVYANESALGNEQRFSHTSVMMIHGDADQTVDVSHSRKLNQSLSTLGYIVKYIEVPGGVHNAGSMISGRELIILNWFISHPLAANFSMNLNPGWSMISFPVVPLNKSFASIFSEVEYYQIVTWNGTSYRTPTEMEADHSYWALVLTETTVNITDGVPTEQYERDLPAGWNMIGSVYGNSVNCASVFPSYYQALTWSGTNYITATTIEPGKGYWALVLTPTHISLY